MVATGWSTKELKRGKKFFKTRDEITAVACSTCGNMVWVGDKSGEIIEYNIQSGNKRQVFTGHTQAIIGLGAQCKSITKKTPNKAL